MAAGDINLNVAKSIPNLVFADQTIAQLPQQMITVAFFEGGPAGPSHSVRLTDASCVGFDYSAGVFTDSIPRAILGEFTKIRAILYGAGASGMAARQTAAIQALVTDGVITLQGNVQ